MGGYKVQYESVPFAPSCLFPRASNYYGCSIPFELLGTSFIEIFFWVSMECANLLMSCIYMLCIIHRLIYIIYSYCFISIFMSIQKLKSPALNSESLSKSRSERENQLNQHSVVSSAKLTNLDIWWSSGTGVTLKTTKRGLSARLRREGCARGWRGCKRGECKTELRENFF